MKTIFLVSLIIITGLSPIFGQNPTGTFTDPRDGHTYKYVEIGTQTWMAENLAYLPSVSPSSAGSDTDPYHYVYGYEGSSVASAKATANYTTYGVLYNWPAALTACPSGWHLPTDEEWKILEKNQGMSDSDADVSGYRVSGAVGGKLKETGTSHWLSPNAGATNSNGFTALPGGFRGYTGDFSHLGLLANFWSASAFGSDAWVRGLYNYNDGLYRESSYRRNSFSVRCLKTVENPTGTFTDPRDGHTYKYVEIGTQTWMAENLAYLPSVSSSSTGSETLTYNYVYGYESTDVSTAKATENFSTYGVLYNWQAALTACPSGWHLPSDEEWKILEKNQGMTNTEADATGWRISGSVGGKFKEAGTPHWVSPNTGATNSSGFTALPGGYRYPGGFYNLGLYAYFWSASEDGTSYTWTRYLGYDNDGVGRNYGSRDVGFSLRCLKTIENPTGAFTDPRDGHTYKYVEIGTQTWMAENLAYLPAVSPPSDGDLILPYYYVNDYHGSSLTEAKAGNSFNTYGVLYNWQAATSGCPIGWHLPTDGEWTVLTDYLINNGYGYGGSGDYIGKSISAKSGWNSDIFPGNIGNDQGSNNSSGFTALPGGFRQFYDGNFYISGYAARFWSATESGISKARDGELGFDGHGLGRGENDRASGFSVRCLQNNISATLQFPPSATPFKQPSFSTKSKSYFYYPIVESSATLPVGMVFNFTIPSNGVSIPCGLEYMGGGILKLWLDLSGQSSPTTITVTLPDIITQSASSVTLINKPAPFYVQVENSSVSQTIDVFAGGSAGVRFLVGSVGALASASAASLSVSGTGGMGLKFKKDSNGDEYISRRFEPGISVAFKAPDVNMVVGEIKVGINAGISNKLIVGQTMYFPAILNSDVVKMAKAAFILETLSLGGVELSPFASTFFKACLLTLKGINSDLSQIFSEFYNSNEFGVAVEGSASAGLSVALDGNNKQTKLEMVGFSGKITLNDLETIYNHNSNRSRQFGCAMEFGLSAINFRAGGLDLGNLLDYKYGTDISLKADYNPSQGLNSFKYSFGAGPTAEVSIFSYTPKDNYEVLVPKSVIDHSYITDNLISQVAPMFLSGLPKRPFKFGPSYFAGNLETFFANSNNQLSSMNDHVILQTTRSIQEGVKFEPKITLDVALGVGAGLKLGIELSYLDEISSVKNQRTIVDGKVLPIVEFSDITESSKLMTLQDELFQLFDGTVMLIDHALNTLTTKIEQAAEAGQRIFIQAADKVFNLSGTILNKGRMIIRKLDPTGKSLLKSTSSEPRVVNAYASRRVIHATNKSGKLSGEPEPSLLYIISDNFNVSLLDDSDQVVNSFDKLKLTIAIDPVKLNELGFGEEVKALAKMYRYDADSLRWIELPGDLNPHIDSVSLMIDQSASYAVGIEIAASFDKSAPEIQDYYPKEGDSVAPKAKYWARLYEPPTGVGIDFSRTRLKIDTTVVNAFWNPVDRIISYEPIVPIAPGNHTFEVIAVDYNGNLASQSLSYYSEFQPSVSIQKSLSAGWTWFSINVEDVDMSTATVLSSLKPKDGDYIKNQTVSATYYEGTGWFGELTSINPGEMYKIKLGKADTLQFDGIPVDLINDSIPVKNGWNWIGYLPQSAQPVTEALSTIAPVTNDYIKNQIRSSTYYEGAGWFGELNNLYPLDGYMLKTSHADTLAYPEPDSGSFTDTRDHNTYPWIKIGDQTWMAGNLAWMPSVSPSSAGSETVPCYYVYGYEGTAVTVANVDSNYAIYGMLYNWEAAKTACPGGWHLPNDAEWTILTDYLTNNGYGYGGSGSDIGKSMAFTSGWTSNSTAGTIGNTQASNNSSGFTALPGGYRSQDGFFGGLDNIAYFWSSTEDRSSGAWYRGLGYGSDFVSRDQLNNFRSRGFSVRCIRD